MKKLLIWDGDETLWNGTILTRDKIELPVGRLALLEDLHDRGVLQALATYNHSEDIASVIHKYGLDRWFLHNRAGFDQTKAEMIQGIIKDYDLSRESDVVFLDDNAFNLAEVNKVLPGVLTYFPDDLVHVIDVHFTKNHYTEEDHLRVRRYQSEERRQAAAAEYPGDRQDFLRSCGILMEIRRSEERDSARVLDLYERANRMAAVDPDLKVSELLHQTVFVANVSDLYGNYGLSAFIALHGNKIQALVVSCRLQGRGIGSAFLGYIINQFYPGTIKAEWLETKYNAGMKDLFKWYNFTFEEGVYTTTIEAELEIDDPVILPNWVEVREA